MMTWNGDAPSTSPYDVHLSNKRNDNEESHPRPTTHRSIPRLRRSRAALTQAMRGSLPMVLVLLAGLSVSIKDCAGLSTPVRMTPSCTSLHDGETPIDIKSIETSERKHLPRQQTRRKFMHGSVSVGLGFMVAAVTLPTSAHAAELPFFPTRFETVDQVPKEYFDKQRSIYAFCERVIDGDTLRVRHVPGYNSIVGALTGATNVQPLASRGIADQTLIVRLYGVDAPEVAKPSNGNDGQPFSQDAKDYTSDLVYHEIVKVTFLKKDQYRRAVCQVETLPKFGLLRFLPGFGPRDLSIELAAAGLAELYTGGGAEYNGRRDVLVKWIDRAKRSGKGIWSLKDGERVSAADFKRGMAGTTVGRDGPVRSKSARKRKGSTVTPLMSPAPAT